MSATAYLSLLAKRHEAALGMICCWWFREGKKWRERPWNDLFATFLASLGAVTKHPARCLSTSPAENAVTLGPLSCDAFIPVSVSCANLIKLFSHTATFRPTCITSAKERVAQRSEKSWPLPTDRPTVYDGLMFALSRILHDPQLIIEALCFPVDTACASLTVGPVFPAFQNFLFYKVIRAPLFEGKINIWGRANAIWNILTRRKRLIKVSMPSVEKVDMKDGCLSEEIKSLNRRHNDDIGGCFSFKRYDLCGLSVF